MVITENYKKGLQLIKEGKMDDARDCLDTALAHLSQQTVEYKLTDKSEVEGVRRELWLERIFAALENNDLML
jgi:ribosomal protein L20